LPASWRSGRGNPQFLEDCGAGALVSDFSPLRISIGWKNAIAARTAIPFYEVDAHNVIPCWHASAKQEWAAYSFRPKVHRLLREFLVDFPAIKRQEIRWPGEVENDWKRAEKGIEVEAVSEVNWLVPGEAAARAILEDFLSRKLPGYDLGRNDPTKDGQSNLSPYLHFGQISAQRAAMQALSGQRMQALFWRSWLSGGSWGRISVTTTRIMTRSTLFLVGLRRRFGCIRRIGASISIP